ncbi:DUF427 domain-containing protein [Streptomyces sp. NPDC056463]|uniref:DUF427 domain-containing protein n=1 Tax=Streptomyces sp. NPDC056463 TaxID=3345827 RepID=UPI00368FD175
MPGRESVWDYPRPPRVETDSRHLAVVVGSVVVASTNAGLRLLETSHPPAFYFPRGDVRMEYLRTSPDRTLCEWKGTATHWDIAVGTTLVRRAAWSYERPRDEYTAIEGHLAFYPGKALCTVDGEAVMCQPGDFYGGWITPETDGPFKGGPGTRSW